MKKEDIQLIETYLLGQLNENEQLAVKQRAMEDPDFAAEMALQTDILNGIVWHEDELMKQKIALVDKSLAQEGFFSPNHGASPPSKAKTALTKWQWALTISSVLAIFFLIWFFFSDKSAPRPSPALPNPNPTPTQPIAQNSPQAVPKIPESKRETPLNYPPKTLQQTSLWTPPDYANYRSDNGPSDIANQARSAFQQKKYAAVLRMVAKVPASDPNYWYYQEMAGHAAYLSNRFSEATRFFENIATSGQMPFSERAEWYLLLCYLTDYQKNKSAFERLKQKIIQDSGHPYYEQAKAL